MCVSEQWYKQAEQLILGVFCYALCWETKVPYLV